MGKWAPWLALAACLVLGGYLLDRQHTQGQLIKAQLEQSRAKNVQLAKEVEASTAERVAAEKREAERDAQAARREALLLDALARVKAATPQQLVDDGARLLGASDITTDGRTVTMGVETWRGAVRLMVLGNEYETTAKPAWDAQVKGWAETKAALHGEVQAHVNKEAGLEKTIKDLGAALGHEKRASVLEKAAWAAAGAGVGLVLGKVLK
jgi:hypothetical protein